MLERDKFKPHLRELCKRLEFIRDTELSSDRYLQLVKLKSERICERLLFSSSALDELVIKLALEHLKNLFQQADEVVSKGQEKEAEDINPKLEKIILSINCH